MSTKLVALTFDDGPSNITERFLDVLEEKGIVGTFFLIGDLITPEKAPIMKRQIAMGCEIANHSLTHSDMSKMDAETIRAEIAETTRRIEEFAGVTPRFFRPPFISLSDTMYESIDLPFICGEDSRDWDPSTSTEDRIERVLKGVKDGTLVLMHDLKDNEKTLAALPAIIDGLRAEGYEFVTASEIFARKGIDPHVAHKMWSNVFD